MARRGHRPSQAQGNRPRFWGRHAVLAALANPDRVVRKLWGTREALAALDLPPVLPVVYADGADLGRLVPSDAPHQGLVAEVEPLDELWLGDLLDRKTDAKRPLLVLDQVTDPHNVGAILRSSAVFGASGLVMTHRHSPPLNGVLAKSASGALELIPVALVANLARALDELREAGFAIVGLDGSADTAIEDLDWSRPTALVMGSEGKGLRELTRKTCDTLARISTDGPVASLNVSNAAAIALYAAMRARQK